MSTAFRLFTSQRALPFLEAFSADHLQPAMKMPLLGGDVYDVGAPFERAQALRLIEMGRQTVQEGHMLCPVGASVAVPHTEQKWFIHIENEGHVHFFCARGDLNRWDQIDIDSSSAGMNIHFTIGEEDRRAAEMSYLCPGEEELIGHDFKYWIMAGGDQLAALARYFGLVETAPVKAVGYQILSRLGVGLNELLDSSNRKAALDAVKPSIEKFLLAVEQTNGIVLDEDTRINIDYDAETDKSEGFLITSIYSTSGSLFALSEVARPFWDWAAGK